MIKIAILGNGQLARMLEESAVGMNVCINSYPLPQIDHNGDTSPEGILYWKDKLSAYDVVTYEIENISVRLLEEINEVTNVYPAINALKVSQDRLLEKEMFSNLGIQTNQFIKINSLESLHRISHKLGFPFILKTRRFGYDGKGQYLIKASSDIINAWDLLGKQDLIAESFVNFDFEVAQIATRDKKGHIVFYPLVRNEHRDGILRETYVLKSESIISKKAKDVASQILRHFDYIGTLAIEFFVVHDELYINEMAPRVHNSGHWSIDGSITSQFKNHILSISDMNLGSSTEVHPYITMINLIGEDILDNRFKALAGVFLKSYGKEIRPGRKMGHINIVSDNINIHENTLNKVYKELGAARILLQPPY